jgi:pyruvate dehydrogenase E1 component alpha subunit/2-oxoisovalerate dehydrogenase E1 component alpha subunit
MVHALESVTSEKAAEQATAPEAIRFQDAFLRAFRSMLLARVLDEKFANLYRAGKIHGGVFLGRGQEALSVSIGQQLCPGDVFAPLIRDLAGRLAFGQPILDTVRNYLGSRLGPTMGRDGNVHHGRPADGLLHMVSHLGAMISVVNGVLLARRLKGVDGIVGVSCVGDGATSTGAFHEALNQSAVEKLPLVLVVANNQFAYSTPNSRQFACRNLVDRAAGYGIRGHSVDGTDLAACLRVLNRALQCARLGQGPQLVVAHLLRLCGHGEHDDANYIDARLKQSPHGRDCLKVAEEYLLNQNWIDAKTLVCWRADAVRQIEDAVATVQREPVPDPYQENWSALSSQHLNEVHEESPPSLLEKPASLR